MTYSNLFIKKDIRIPTVLSLFIVGFIIFTMGSVFFNTKPSSLRATKKIVKKLEVTNISSTQATIFWQTDTKEPGWVVFGQEEGALTRAAFDERDFQNKKNLFQNHYTILKDLKENTRYYFKLTNGAELMSDGAKAFTFRTTARLTQLTNLKPAYGKIVRPNGTPLEGGIVILLVKGAYPLTALSKATGEWLIPLTMIIDKTHNTLKVVGTEEPVKIEVYSESEGSSFITSSVGGISPLPDTVSIGRNYTFSESPDILSATNQNKTYSVDIVFPKEGAIIPASNPLIKGTGVPGQEVDVSVTEGSGTTSQLLRVDKDGSWKLAVKGSLSPGAHRVSVSGAERGGASVKKSRTFTIAKVGQQVQGVATPESSLTPTSTPTSTPAPTASSSATPTPPVSGGNIGFMILSSISLLVVGLGLLVLF